MSQTAVTSKTEGVIRTVTLQNGDVFSFNSNNSTGLEKIPIIDASRIWSHKLEERKAVAEKIREASRDIGFFYLVNHGIDPKFADAVLHQARRFFALPEEKKMEVFTGLIPNEYVGYHPMECYNRNGWKRQGSSASSSPYIHDADECRPERSLQLGNDASEDPEAQDKTEKSVSTWPSDLPGFREELYAYHTQLLQLSRRLTRIFALALHLSEDYFDAYTKRPEAGMRILHYPEQVHSIDEQNGIGAHTDVECFTIVTQDSAGGLEVLSKTGNWIKAEPIEGSFVVNIVSCRVPLTKPVTGRSQK